MKETSSKNKPLSPSSQTPLLTLMDKLKDVKSDPETLKGTIHKRVMEDLEDMFATAKEAGNLSTALKVKELQGKNFGMFGHEKEDPNKGIPIKPLCKMTPQELMRLIKSTCELLEIDERTVFEERA